MQVTPRAIAVIALAAIAGIFAIAATATPLSKMTQSGPGYEATQTMTMWRVCTKVEASGFTRDDCQDIDPMIEGQCSYTSRFRAMRAFSILTILVCFLAAVPLGVIDLVNLAVLPSNLRKIAMAAVGGVVALFSLIAWAIWAAIWDGTGMDCNASALKDIDGAKWGPMAPLMIVVMVLGIGLAVAAMIAPGPVAEATDAAGPDKEQPAGLGLGSPEGDDELQKPAQQPQEA